MVSRVAKYPVDVPSGVEVHILNGVIRVKGKKGELSQSLSPLVSLVKTGTQLVVSSQGEETRESIKLTGTVRALVNNMVQGVSQGFERKLLMVGVGYRAKTQGSVLNLSAGFSHPVDLDMPSGITVETPTVTEIIVRGADKQRVGQVAANIRAVRPPEPYKGKGIRYSDERVVIKEVKKK